ncbi:MAG: transglycosylase SLT domain-containing protein [Gammaproteobacteria bacterium]|nr:transglycosylase SLT domain-containing protein [Gammaproteobacteria bacterium]
MIHVSMMRYINHFLNALFFLIFCATAYGNVGSADAAQVGKTDSVENKASTTTSGVVDVANIDDVNDTRSLRSNSNVIKRQRDLYRDAVIALENGDLKRFDVLRNQNKDYILYPYLVYYDLRNRLSSATHDEINHFMEHYQKTPLSYRIRTQWLYRLAEDEQWATYLNVYRQQGGAKLRCSYLHAKLKTDRSKQTFKRVMKQVEKLWLVGKAQPKECDTLFEHLAKSSGMTSQLIWQRIELAMQAGNTKLATQLAKQFGNRDKKAVERWVEVHKNAEQGLKAKGLRKNTLINRQIVLHGIRRIARRDAEKAITLWETLSRRYGFNVDQKGTMKRFLALRSAYQQHPNALKWLLDIKGKWVNGKVREWRALTALRLQDWNALKISVNNLTPKEKNDVKWRYWLARSEAQLGNQKQAFEIFEAVALETNYYGFMASDRLGKSYTFNLEQLVRDEPGLADIANRPAILRAKELFLLGEDIDARREWNYGTRNFKESQLKLAAILVHQWGWHSNAILTIAKTSHRRDYGLRFPLPHRDLVFINAETHGIDPSLIFGVARRESAFRKDARSSAGALGLMQLMPGTARMESKRLGRHKISKNEILEAENNILLGSSYLNRMLDRFGGNQAVATAAYNAGPRRVDSWIPESDPVSSDVWVDTLPFRETREYVRAVLAYSTIFNWRLDKKITPITARMYSVISKEVLAELNSIRRGSIN